MKKIIIVMPVANEEATMGSMIESILALPYDNLFLYPVIDSYSKDRTEEIIRSYEHTGRVKCIFYEKSTGVISCYLEGYRRALADGAECVLETKLSDMTSGFEGFQAEVLQKLNLDKFLSTGHMYQTEMRFYCRKLHCVEVPIHYIGGDSSLRFKSVTEALKILFQLKKHEAVIWK